MCTRSLFNTFSRIDDYPILCFDESLQLKFANSCFNADFHENKEVIIADTLAKIKDKNNSQHYMKIGQKRYELISLSLDDKLFIIFKDSTHQIEALEKIKTLGKSFQEERNRFNNILESLSLGLIVTNEDYEVVYSNSKVKNLFHFPSRLSFDKCFYLHKRTKPCEDCPIKNLSSSESFKKTFQLENGKEFITAEYSKTKSGDIFIMFSDNTKEVELLKKIRDYQKTIQRERLKLEKQNNILHSLYEVSLEAGKTDDLNVILDIITNSLSQIFNSPKVAIITFDERYNINYASFKNFSDEEQKKYMKSDLLKDENILEEEASIGQVVMKNKEQKIIGKLFMELSDTTHIDNEILPLFTEQIVTLLDNKLLQKKLEDLAHVDGLTGIFNRYYYNMIFEEEVTKARKFRRHLAIIMVDINGLKKANDVYGHQAGDLLIKSSVDLIKNNTRKTDYLFRYGGDEVVLILLDCDSEQLEKVIDNLKVVQHGAEFEFKGDMLPIRYSLGGASSDSYDFKELLAMADKNMYIDKVNFYKTNERYR